MVPEMIATETKEREVQSTTTKARTAPPNLNGTSTAGRSSRLLGDSERKVVAPDDSVRSRELNESASRTLAKTESSFEEEHVYLRG